MVEQDAIPGPYQERGEIALSIAQKAAEVAMSYFRDRGNLRTQSKKAEMDLVTEADREIERLIKTELAQKCPDDGFLGEESGGGLADALWIVDPLDGTNNFVAGLPFWAVSIGFLHAGTPVIGAISVPVLGEEFFAAQGQGAFCGGEPIHVSRTDSVNRSRVIFGRSTDLPHDIALEFAENAMRSGALIYSFGCCAFNLTRVANGSCDFYFEERVFPWDAAAGIVLIREAGGFADSDFGSDAIEKGSQIVSTNGLLELGLLLG